MFNKHIHCAIELLCQLLYGCWLQVLLVTYWWYGSIVYIVGMCIDPVLTLRWGRQFSLSLSLSLSHTHTHMHTHTTHTHMHTTPYTTHTHIHTLTLSLSHTHTHTHTPQPNGTSSQPANRQPLKKNLAQNGTKSPLLTTSTNRNTSDSPAKRNGHDSKLCSSNSLANGIASSPHDDVTAQGLKTKSDLKSSSSSSLKEASPAERRKQLNGSPDENSVSSGVSKSNEHARLTRLNSDGASQVSSRVQSVRANTVSDFSLRPSSPLAMNLASRHLASIIGRHQVRERSCTPSPSPLTPTPTSQSSTNQTKFFVFPEVGEPSVKSSNCSSSSEQTTTTVIERPPENRSTSTPKTNGPLVSAQKDTGPSYASTATSMAGNVPQKRTGQAPEAVTSVPTSREEELVSSSSSIGPVEVMISFEPEDETGEKDVPLNSKEHFQTAAGGKLPKTEGAWSHPREASSQHTSITRLTGNDVADGGSVSRDSPSVSTSSSFEYENFEVTPPKSDSYDGLASASAKPAFSFKFESYDGPASASSKPASSSKQTSLEKPKATSLEKAKQNKKGSKDSSHKNPVDLLAYRPLDTNPVDLPVYRPLDTSSTNHITYVERHSFELSQNVEDSPGSSLVGLCGTGDLTKIEEGKSDRGDLKSSWKRGSSLKSGKKGSKDDGPMVKRASSYFGGSKDSKREKEKVKSNESTAEKKWDSKKRKGDHKRRSSLSGILHPRKTSETPPNDSPSPLGTSSKPPLPTSSGKKSNKPALSFRGGSKRADISSGGLSKFSMPNLFSPEHSCRSSSTPDSDGDSPSRSTDVKEEKDKKLSSLRRLSLSMKNMMKGSSKGATSRTSWTFTDVSPQSTLKSTTSDHKLDVLTEKEREILLEDTEVVPRRYSLECMHSPTQEKSVDVSSAEKPPKPASDSDDDYETASESEDYVHSSISIITVPSDTLAKKAGYGTPLRSRSTPAYPQQGTYAQADPYSSNLPSVAQVVPSSSNLSSVAHVIPTSSNLPSVTQVVPISSNLQLGAKVDADPLNLKLEATTNPPIPERLPKDQNPRIPERLLQPDNVEESPSVPPFAGSSRKASTKQPSVEDTSSAEQSPVPERFSRFSKVRVPVRKNSTSSKLAATSSPLSKRVERIKERKRQEKQRDNSGSSTPASTPTTPRRALSVPQGPSLASIKARKKSPASSPSPRKRKIGIAFHSSQKPGDKKPQNEKVRKGSNSTGMSPRFVKTPVELESKTSSMHLDVDSLLSRVGQKLDMLQLSPETSESDTSKSHSNVSQRSELMTSLELDLGPSAMSLESSDSLGPLPLSLGPEIACMPASVFSPTSSTHSRQSSFDFDIDTIERPKRGLTTPPPEVVITPEHTPIPSRRIVTHGAPTKGKSPSPFHQNKLGVLQDVPKKKSGPASGFTEATPIKVKVAATQGPVRQRVTPIKTEERAVPIQQRGNRTALPSSTPKKQQSITTNLSTLPSANTPTSVRTPRTLTPASKSETRLPMERTPSRPMERTPSNQRTSFTAALPPKPQSSMKRPRSESLLSPPWTTSTPPSSNKTPTPSSSLVRGTGARSSGRKSTPTNVSSNSSGSAKANSSLAITDSKGAPARSSLRASGRLKKLSAPASPVSSSKASPLPTTSGKSPLRGASPLTKSPEDKLGATKPTSSLMQRATTSGTPERKSVKSKSHMSLTRPTSARKTSAQAGTSKDGTSGTITTSPIRHSMRRMSSGEIPRRIKPGASATLTLRRDRKSSQSTLNSSMRISRTSSSIRPHTSSASNIRNSVVSRSMRVSRTTSTGRRMSSMGTLPRTSTLRRMHTPPTSVVSAGTIQSSPARVSMKRTSSASKEVFAVFDQISAEAQPSM